jgi:AcrR family transcriptional regulator
VEDILAAASRVLTREGGAAFTTLRVAEVAGVSVGSLYQYFPGKEAILFALHRREWEATRARMEALLGRADLPFPERVRGALLVFFETEREEVALRCALADSDRQFKATEAFRDLEESTKRRCGVLLARALPRARRRDARDIVEVVFRLTVALSATLAEGPAGGEEARRLVAIHVDMVTCYLDRLRAAGRGDRA